MMMEITRVVSVCSATSMIVSYFFKYHITFYCAMQLFLLVGELDLDDSMSAFIKKTSLYL